jgi:hypothetical protein
LNLLTKSSEAVESNYLTIGSFRSAQYDLINYFMNLCVEYVSKQNKNYLTLQKVNIYEIPTYVGIHNSSLTQVVVEASFNTPTGIMCKPFMSFLIPTLVDDCFFILNGNYFVPTLYILDKPIVIKKKSVKLSSTFNSITIYDKLITFMGNNMPAIYFLNIFLSDTDPAQATLKQEFIQAFKISATQISEQDLLSYFATLFKCDPDRLVIQDHFHTIFFDDYTKLLYRQCYKLEDHELNIQTLLQIAMNLNKSMTADSFIDLDQKRLVFIEILLWPIFKRIAQTASRASRGFYINEIAMYQMELIKNFYINLHNKFIYDNVNAYDTMLQHKAYMLSPNAEQAPSMIANLHPSHYKRICPTSVSSQNPGETIYIISETQLDHFGQFI